MRTIVLALAVGAAAPADAEVVSADPHAFEVRETINMIVPPAQAYAAFGQVGGWWSKAHSDSGNSANLSLELRPGGCFCERLDGGGGVEHLRVSMVQPGEHVVLTGALGPLLGEAVAGVMDVEFKPIAGGSRVIIGYRAAGFARGNAATLAPAVDAVLGEQAKRLRAFATAYRPKQR